LSEESGESETSNSSSETSEENPEQPQEQELKKEQEKEKEGESLLLPLLNGILQNPKYRNLSARNVLSLKLSRAIAQQSSLVPHSSVCKMNSEQNNLKNDNRLGHDFPIVEDSGTESGEDLRLLAASLQSMDDLKKDEEVRSESVEYKEKNESLGTDLLNEVTTALERLQDSLNQGQIALDDNRKSALLSLVNRLQVGLISPDKKMEANVDNEAAVGLNVSSPLEQKNQEIINDVRRGSGESVNRFSKRKNRASRHTVGVTREELADARRIIEELELIGIKNTKPTTPVQPTVTATVLNSTPGVYNAILTRQISEPVTLLRPSQFVPKESSQQIEYPGKPKYKMLFKQSISLDQPSSILKHQVKQDVIYTTKIDDIEQKKISLQRTSSGTNGNKFTTNNHNKENENDAPTDESSSSEDEEMINTKFYNNNINASNKFKAKENFLRNQNLNYSSGDEASPSNRPSKYISKKMKMKRANTVDLPKSYSFVNTFNMNDKDSSDNESMRQTHHNRSPGLKTTFSGGNAPMPPKFTPKTDNDKKFMEFINKQNSNIVPTYVNPATPRNEQKQQNWTNKFGNLKHKFEDNVTEQSQKPVPKASNAAASFWKTIEKDKPSAKVSPLQAVPIRNPQPFTKNLPITSEKFPWKNTPAEGFTRNSDPIIGKKKQLVDKFIAKDHQEIILPKLVPEPNKLPALKPTNVNNFSHAPMSAFKPPISRKLSNSFKPIQTNDELTKKPMPQISNGVVKQMAETGYNVNNPPLPQPRKIVSSPTRSIAQNDMGFVKVKKVIETKVEPVPWSAKPKSDRVLNLAASKFENVPTVHLASHLDAATAEPTVKFRNNPLYNGTFEKRSSLPLAGNYTTFDASFLKKETAPPKVEKESTFVITDFTQPTYVSTYVPTDVSPLGRPKLKRQDSLTNPEKEPLILTCDRTVISPNTKPQFDEPLQISNNNSTLGSICGDLEHELDDLGESIECQVAVSKVMRGPVAQTANIQSSELTSLSNQSNESSLMKNLQDSLKKVQQKSPTPEKRVDVKRLSQDSSNSSIDQLKLQSPFKRPAGESESRLSQDSSNSSIVDSKLPPFKIPIPAVPETSYSITYKSPPRIQVKSPSTDPPAHVLYNNLQRTSSINSLVLPKALERTSPVSPIGMYGVPQKIIDQKKKTVASYFSVAPQRTESLKQKTKPFSVAAPLPAVRKISLQVKPMTQQSIVKRAQSMNTLSRSKTMPTLANVELLDESNIDDAFEELLSSSNL
jgi:hypothetical protein